MFDKIKLITHKYRGLLHLLSVTVIMHVWVALCVSYAPTSMATVPGRASADRSCVCAGQHAAFESSLRFFAAYNVHEKELKVFARLILPSVPSSSGVELSNRLSVKRKIAHVECTLQC